MTESKSGVKILTFDIETAPITAFVWDLYKQNIGLNQIKADWHLIAWAAKWYGKDEVIYRDNRNSKDIADDKKLVEELQLLINEADVVISQNGEEFDLKKLNARAVFHGLKPTKPAMSTDILKEGRKVFSFTSHKLEYVTGKLNKKYKKLKHEKYPGFDLWAAIMAGDKKAWAEMETYTKHDVLATEEAYQVISGWIKTQAFSHAYDDTVLRCKCGGKNLEKRGMAWTAVGKYQRYQCRSCGKWLKGRKNLLSVEKRAATLRETRKEN